MENRANPGVVIVGAGQAGAETATALRQQGYAGPVTLIGEEVYPPYRRPPLSKTFLAGEVSLESLYLKAATVYEKHGIACRLGVRATAIDTGARQVQLDDGSRLPYSALVLATGGRPRVLPVPGADVACLHYVRTIDDVLRLREAFRANARLVLIGGGYIGLEIAAVAAAQGLRVTVIEAMDRVLARVAAPQLSAFYQSVHRQHGVEIVTGAAVAGLQATPYGALVQLDGGQQYPADLVIAGIGLIPEVRLAQAAGATTSSKGIEVDSACRTSVPDLYAVGDCTCCENGFYGRAIHLESVPNATDQARVLAAVLAGKEARYDTVPWFWSDQYDLKLQMAGLSEGHDHTVVRGDRDTPSFIVFYLRAGVVISADAVNRPRDFMIARRLIAARACPPPALLADEAVPLKTILEGGAD